VLLFLTGLVLWHGGFSFGSLSLDSILGEPAAVINGEPISRAALKARVKTIQVIVERQHGEDIFVGERGRALWANLQNAVLNEMLEEKLVSQEGRKLGVQITEKQVQQKLDQIIKEDFGTWENFQTRLQEEGMSKEDLQEDIRNLLLVEAIKKLKAQERTNSDVSFATWLLQARQKAEVTIYNSGNQAPGPSALAGGCCGSGGSSGGCSVWGGTARQADPRIEREAQSAALQTFQKSNPAEKGVTAKVTDYGCHIQVDIQKEGRVIKSYSYQNGKIEEAS
jgi:parvulin-like peptidyl-prolyl isomerase